MPLRTESTLAKPSQSGAIKCVVWDLDNTLWDGVLLEDEPVTLRADVVKIIKTLDGRGILQSIASKNDRFLAMSRLQELHLAEYFLYPQISWNSKSSAIKRISEQINIGVDAIALVDDQAFERDEVNYSLPRTLCIDAAELDRILEMPEMMPRFITEDSRARRLMYLSDIKRKEIEAEFAGPQEEFLATLGMTFSISRAKEEDLQRAEELTVRTHQLNTTGYTYSYDELALLRQSDQHLFLVGTLEDKYGTYGKIGLALVECLASVWTIKLLLMSCRVISRGVGTIMINHIRSLARRRRVALRAEFLPTTSNRMMYVTYKFAGFRECGETGGLTILEDDLSQIPSFPEYIQVEIPA